MTEVKSPDTNPPVLLRRDGAVAIAQLNRPDKRNSMDLAMRRTIASTFSELEGDDTVGAIVVTGGADVFAAGADINLLVDKGAQQMGDLDLGQYWLPIAQCTKPVIAAVSGFALGAGCELALMCDIIVADASARFGQPELKVGIMPGAGGTQRLVRILGKYVASMVLLAGEMVDGERAFQLGLVADLAPTGRALDRALELARKAARMPPKAVRATKRVLRQGPDLPLDAALALENREFLLLFDTEDKTAGMRAFLEKRKPEFTGR
jgi:enoyl-CoA hydratase